MIQKKMKANGSMKTFREIAEKIILEGISYKVSQKDFEKGYKRWQDGDIGKVEQKGSTTFYWKDSEIMFSYDGKRLVVMAQGKQLFQIKEMNAA